MPVLSELEYGTEPNVPMWVARRVRCLGQGQKGAWEAPHVCWFLEAVQTTAHRSQRTGMNKRIWGRVERGGNLGLVNPNVCFRMYSDYHKTAFLFMSIFKR